MGTKIKYMEKTEVFEIEYRQGLYGFGNSQHLFNHIRSGIFETIHNFENYFINLYHIMHVHFTRCFTHVPVQFFLNRDFDHVTGISKYKVEKIFIKIIDAEF